MVEFDEVVVTAPLGWLKRNMQAFHNSTPGRRVSPRPSNSDTTMAADSSQGTCALPRRLAQAIENIGYGTLDKVYITFPSAFWDTPQSTDHHISNGVDPRHTTPNLTATTLPLHKPASQTEEPHYPGFTHWLAPNYAPESNANHWDQQGMNLAALPGSCAHPTLLFYIYGDCSRYIAKLVSSTPRADERDAKLLEFFEPYYSRLPNYAASSTHCKPRAVLATAWANDEFAGYGSYSNFQVGLEKGDEDIEVMRRGAPEKGLWLAGEHTAPFVALGTSTGAYWSGEGVANRIVKAYQVEVRE